MLEVRLLYRRLEAFNQVLEQTVAERTAELRESEARYRSLTELASDWYWEQDESGAFTQVSGPVLELLGIPVESDRQSAVSGKRVSVRVDLGGRRHIKHKHPTSTPSAHTSHQNNHSQTQ